MSDVGCKSVESDASYPCCKFRILFTVEPVKHLTMYLLHPAREGYSQNVFAKVNK